MDESKRRIREIEAELSKVADCFEQVRTDGSGRAAAILLEMQRRVDGLRLAVWEARLACDPHLTPPRIPPGPDDSQSLTDRVLGLVDSRKRGGAA